MKIPLLGFRLCKTNETFEMKLFVESRQMLGLFIELKFCMAYIYFLNKHTKCNVFVYKFASVYIIEFIKLVAKNNEMLAKPCI